MVIQSTLYELTLKVTSLSLVALERSIKVGSNTVRNKRELSIRTRKLSGRAKEVTGNIKRLKVMRALLHQSHYRRAERNPEQIAGLTRADRPVVH